MNDQNTSEQKVELVDEKLLENYRKDYQNPVHKVGRITMTLGFILSFSPIAYLYFVVGIRPPATAFVSVIVAVVGFALAMWLTEPLSYFPILGAAGTYMGYFSGNVSNMRFPVAMSVQNAYSTDASSPRGNMLTVIAIATSVFVNLVILLTLVLFGTALIAALPPVIIRSFSYVVPALFGSSLVMRMSRNFKDSAKYLPVALVAFFITKFIPKTATFGVAIAVGLSVLFAYVIFKNDKS